MASAGSVTALLLALTLVLGLHLYLVTTLDGMPIPWWLPSAKLGERDVALELLGHDQLKTSSCSPTKGFSGRDFEHQAAEPGINFVRSDRRNEPTATATSP